MPLLLLLLETAARLRSGPSTLLSCPAAAAEDEEDMEPV